MCYKRLIQLVLIYLLNVYNKIDINNILSKNVKFSLCSSFGRRDVSKGLHCGSVLLGTRNSNLYIFPYT